MSTPIFILTMHDHYKEDPEGDYEYLEYSGQIEILANDLPWPFNIHPEEIGPEELVVFTADNEDLRSGLIPIIIRI